MAGQTVTVEDEADKLRLTLRGCAKTQDSHTPRSRNRTDKQAGATVVTAAPDGMLPSTVWKLPPRSRNRKDKQAGATVVTAAPDGV